jgi:subtilisin-like proprotein convertase family protein/thiol-disulfide isomerase/thioredoxin
VRNTRGPILSGRERSHARKRLSLGMAIVTVAMLGGTVFAGAAQAASTTTKKTVSSTTTVPIPDWAPHVDGSTGIGESPIAVSGILGNITKVTASVYISHGNVADLDVGIIGPDPNTFTFAFLFDRDALQGTGLGASCADADRTTFDDSAASSIETGAPPYVGGFRPKDDLNVPLSAFNGNVGGTDGTWVLDAFDQRQGNTGTIECWSLFIETDQAQALRFDSGGPVAIADGVEESGGPGVGTSPITVTGLNGGVSNVTVSVYVTHPQDSDLDLVLVSPAGQEVKLAARVGGVGNNFGTSCSKTTTFDGAAKTSISTGAAPFVGSFKPSEAVTLFNGSPPNGEWQLRAVDNAANKVGQINCWSITVTASTATAPSGVILTPRLNQPQPLPGAFNYAYFTIKNSTPSAMNNVTLTGTIPAGLSDVREEPNSFPSTCDVNVTTFTCTWASIGPGDVVFGGIVGKVGSPKGGKLCLDGNVTATGIKAVKATACFTLSAYPAVDHGTGYAIGDIAHNLSLKDQNGNTVSLSSFAGKYVLLQFTAAWCPPSNFEVPQDRDEIAALNDSNAMGVEVVYLTVMLDGQNVNVASTQANAVNWVNHFDLTTPVLWTANDTNQSARQEFNSYSFQDGQPQPGVPTSIFIRPNGQIFGVRVGLEASGGTTDRFLNDLP